LYSFISNLKKSRINNLLNQHFFEDGIESQYGQLTNHQLERMFELLRETEVRIETLFTSRRSPRHKSVVFCVQMHVWTFLWGERSGRESGPGHIAVRYVLGSLNLFVSPRLKEIETSKGRHNSRRLAMGKTQENCAATARKLIIDDIVTELHALETASSNGHGFADITIQFSDYLDPHQPLQCAFIALVHFWADTETPRQASLIRLTNKVIELKEVA
jgi:hypothetical protein